MKVTFQCLERGHWAVTEQRTQEGCHEHADEVGQRQKGMFECPKSMQCGLRCRGHFKQPRMM